MNIYYNKYYKYKMKYLNLLNNFHGGGKYKTLDNFYNYNPNDNFRKLFSVYHSFPEHIDDIIEFVGREKNILEVGSGAGIIASRLARDGKINMTCTDTKPPENVFHECYIIENPFMNQKSVNKKCINGNIIQEDYQVPKFDALLFIWPPMDSHFNDTTLNWYRPEYILDEALKINKDLKVIVIGEYTTLDDDDTKDDYNSVATGTFEFWKFLTDYFEEEELIDNHYKDVYKTNERTILYKPKRILNYIELKKEYQNLKYKFESLKNNYKKLKIKYNEK